MTEGEKGVLSLFVIGVMIVVGKVLAGGEPITPRLFVGRMLPGTHHAGTHRNEPARYAVAGR